MKASKRWRLSGAQRRALEALAHDATTRATIAGGRRWVITNDKGFEVPLAGGTLGWLLLNGCVVENAPGDAPGYHISELGKRALAEGVAE